MQTPCFQLLKQAPGSSARLGRVQLAHGEVQTPVFMPVGTYGAVKTQSPEELGALGTQILLGNTYHLNIRPGTDVLDHFGGLHKFMGWDGPILTDSGGFQVFSLSGLKKIDDEGVTFQSHLNGDKIHLTPESCARIQQSIGSDIAMILDECLALPASKSDLRKALIRSLRWTERFLAVPRREGQRIFGILQGGTDLELRRESLRGNLNLDLDGIAIGGLSVGEPHEQMVSVLEHLAPDLPPEKPHYLMGVGTPLDILEAVHCGVDMFDCVMPTRNARNGYLFTPNGPINIRNAKHKFSDEPLNPELFPKVSLGYLRHLFQTKEILGCRLATSNNIHYYHSLMYQIRSAIENGSFDVFYRKHREKFRSFYLKMQVQE